MFFGKQKTIFLSIIITTIFSSGAEENSGSNSLPDKGIGGGSQQRKSDLENRSSNYGGGIFIEQPAFQCFMFIKKGRWLCCVVNQLIPKIRRGSLSIFYGGEWEDMAEVDAITKVEHCRAL